MSQHSGVSTASAERATQRPKVFLTALAGGLLTGAMGIVAGAVLLATGRTIVEQYLVAQFGEEVTRVARDLVTAEIDRAVEKFELKAIAGIVAGALVALLTLLAIRASRAARGVFVIVVLASATISVAQLADADALPASVTVPAVISIFGGLVSAFLMFLPPVNRYGKAKRADR